MLKFLIILGCWLTVSSSLQAQTFEEYQQQISASFNEYKDARDKEFVSFLKQQWSEFQASKGAPRNAEPKPKTIPPALPKPLDSVSPTPKTPGTTPESLVAPVTVLPLVPAAPPAPAKLPPMPPAEPNTSRVTFDYFGVSVTFSYANEMRLSLPALNQTAISNYWSELSKTNYEPLLTQISSYQKNLKLNDWGSYLLIDMLARQIAQNNENESVLLDWFVLAKLGYDSKIGYNDQKTYLMVAIAHPVFQISFFNDGAKKYYLLTRSGRLENVGKLFTFKGNYPNANSALNFQIKSIPQLAGEMKTRQLSFQFGGQHYQINAQYSPRLISYYQNFPQSDYPIYFDANVSDTAMASLLAQLAPLVKGKNEEEAVNLLLRFVQTAFAYQTDEQQFNYEKVMLPEETVFYPYSDCEDRAILFSYLVRHLIGLPVVALHYSDHLATAVAFSAPVKGDAYNFKGKQFVVSDPTYVNANVGMAMPQYKNSKVEIIEM